MNRNAISKRVRRFGEPYILKGAELTPFDAFLTSGKLWVTALQLLPGALIAPLARPTLEYIVQSMEDKRLYEGYTLLPINCRGTLSRFDTTGTRDSFGRSTADTATMIYSDVPLYLYSSADPSDQTSPAISGTKTIYRFSVPNGFTIKQKDQFHIGEQVLTVTAIILTPDSLFTFEALDA